MQTLAALTYANPHATVLFVLAIDILIFGYTVRSLYRIGR